MHGCFWDTLPEWAVGFRTVPQGIWEEKADTDFTEDGLAVRGGPLTSGEA